MRKKVYVAGAYSASDGLTFLDNIRKGMRKSTEVFLSGFSPFCPWLDFQFQLMLKDGEGLTVDDYQSYSIDWLMASDALLLVEGWENSKGTKNEIEIAKENDIPIFESIEELTKWRIKK